VTPSYLLTVVQWSSLGLALGYGLAVVVSLRLWHRR
jgi:hypothetical protein